MDKGEIDDNERKKFPNQTVGKHDVRMRQPGSEEGQRGVDDQSVVVEVTNETPGYANFFVRDPIDDSGKVPVGVFSLRAGLGRFGAVYLDGKLVGMLPKNGEITIPFVTAGNHQYTVVGPDQTITDGRTNVIPNIATSVRLLPPEVKATIY